MYILKIFSLVFCILCLILLSQDLQLYIDIFCLNKNSTIYNSNASFWKLTTVWIPMLISVELNHIFMGKSKDENRIDTLLKSRSPWIRLLFRGALFCGFIHTAFCISMSILFFGVAILSHADSKILNLWFSRGSLGVNIYLYSWAAIIFYSIYRSKKTI